MSSQYSRDHCKIAVVKILQTIGWHTINSTPLEVLTDLLVHYIKQISKVTTDFTTEFGNTEANLDHLGLAFQEMGINLAELNEYVTYVNFCPTAQPVPKFPVHKEDNLNFLKPGSQEVVTRPVHIHEHMPPMYPLLEESDVKPEDTQLIKEEPIDELNATSSSGIPQFKKPADVSPEFRRFKREDEGSRPTREISSVMMTTSGFLSPAREGRLPEAKAPIPPAPVEPPPPPPPAPAPPVPLTSGVPPIDPAVKKKMEKREKKINKELFKPIMEEKIVKKNASVKDVVKMKQKAAAAAAANMATNSPNLVTPNLAHPVPLSFFQSPRLSEIKVSPVLPQKLLRDPPDKALAAAKARTEKFNTTITPIPIKTTSPLSQMTIQQVEKLVNEPDRKKINILRKISNVKDNKVKKEARANTPNLIMDEGTDIVNKISLSSDITIEPIPMRRSPSMFFDDGSPPGTPSTPRTPDIMLHHPSPPLQKEKRKRKDPKPKVKKPRKTQHRPMFTESELMDIIVNRPKTPEPHVNHMRSNQLPAHMGLPSIPFPFLTSFGGPGLIPPQLTTPMFPFSHLGGLPNFGKTPYFASNVPNFSSQMDVTPSLPAKVKEPKEVKEPPPVEVKPPPVEIIPQPPPPIQQQPIQVPETSSSTSIVPPKTPTPPEIIPPKKSKEHKKEKKDKIKKKNKKDKVKEKGEKKKVKEPKKEGKEKVKREKKVKKKDKADKEKEKVVEVLENPVIPKILLKVNSPSPRPETPERKLNIKPIVKKEEDILQEKKREPSPVGLAKISALVTGPPKPKSTSSPVPPPEKQAEEPPPAPAPRTPGRPRLHPLKPKPPPKPKKIEQQAFKRIDEHGNEVWICPKCGQQDDGRPMIGCDGCDAWYHWVCVGIQVPPDENENWYCNPCLVRKNEDFQSDKKRKRKRKEKKEH